MKNPCAAGKSSLKTQGQAVSGCLRAKCGGAIIAPKRAVLSGCLRRSVYSANPFIGTGSAFRLPEKAKRFARRHADKRLDDKGRPF
jgi:hypothetical protein